MTDYREFIMKYLRIVNYDSNSHIARHAHTNRPLQTEKCCLNGMHILLEQLSPAGELREEEFTDPQRQAPGQDP